MKQYKTYKDSGVEWIGDIPEHWKSQDLRYSIDVLTDFTSNGSFASLAKNVNYLESGYSRLVRLTDLRVDLNNEGIYVDENAHNFLKNSELFGGEMLIANVGAYAGLIKIMPNLEGKYTLAPNMFLLRTNQNLKYLFYLLSSPSCAEQLKMMAVSSAQPKLNKDNIRRVKVVIPSPKEQTQIANYLNHKTEQLDSLIAKKEQLIQLLQEERTAMINQAVTKGLDPNVPMNDSGIEWLGEIPAHWVVKKLKYACSLISEKTKEKPDYVLALENIQSWSNEIIGNPFENKMEGDSNLFQTNDILFNKLRPYLAKVVKATRNGGCVGELLVLRPENELSPDFLYQRLSSEMIITIVDGSTYGTKMPRASWDKFISNIEIGIPPLEEQIQIASYIGSKLNDIKSIILKYKSEIDLLKEYKTALISEVVTGKIDVRDEVINSIEYA